MKKLSVFLITMLCFSLWATLATLVDDVIKVLVKKSNKTISPASKQLAKEALEAAVKKYGDDAIRVANKGGFELVEIASKYGDDIFEYAVKNPKAINALINNTDEVLTLTRRIGVEVLEIESSHPGLAIRIVNNFGDDAVRVLSNNSDKTNLTKLLGYAEKSKSTRVRSQLYEHYKKGGDRFLNQLDWKTITAIGLSSSMIISAYKISSGIEDGMGELVDKNPNLGSELIEKIVDNLTKPITIPLLILFLGVVVMLLLKIRRFYFRKKLKENEKRS
jgi:hypothetical protein